MLQHQMQFPSHPRLHLRTWSKLTLAKYKANVYNPSGSSRMFIVNKTPCLIQGFSAPDTWKMNTFSDPSQLMPRPLHRREFCVEIQVFQPLSQVFCSKGSHNSCSVGQFYEATGWRGITYPECLRRIIASISVGRDTRPSLT